MWDTMRKFIWVLLVVVGVTAATLQLSLLVRKYMQYQMVELSEVKDNLPVEYPSVTICNIEPNSMRKIRQLYMQAQGQNLKDWLMFIQKFRFKQSSFVNSIRAFYENLGEDAKKISHDIEDMLIWCRFNREFCTAGNFTAWFDGNYFNCFTFDGGLQMHGTGPENGLSLILSIEKDEPLEGTYGVYNFENNILHSAGIRVVVHAPGSMPSPVDHGFDVPPGYSTSVGIKPILNTRLSKPYGTCTKDLLKGAKTYTNTHFTCLQLCKQRIIAQKCKCKSSALPDLPDFDLPFCGAISDWKAIARNATRGKLIPLPKLACEEKSQKDFNDNRTYEADCGCHQPCSEFSYLKSVSMSYWPIEFHQLSVLEHFVKKQARENEDKKLLEKAYDLLHKMAQPWPTDTAGKSEVDDMLLSGKGRELARKASDIVRQNMLRLNIYLEDLTIMEYKQLPAYETADLLADAGGTLVLWLAIAVLVTMGLVEPMMVRIFRAKSDGKEKDAAATKYYYINNKNDDDGRECQPLVSVVKDELSTSTTSVQLGEASMVTGLIH